MFGKIKFVPKQYFYVVDMTLAQWNTTDICYLFLVNMYMFYFVYCNKIKKNTWIQFIRT